MLGLVGAGGIAPGVAPSLVGLDAQIAPHLRVEPLGEPFRRLDTQAVDVQLLGELAVGFELLDQLGHLGADCHALEGDDVALAGTEIVQRPEEVGEADPVVLWLAREDQPLQLTLRILSVEDDQLVPVGGAGEVAEPGSRMQVVLLSPHPLEARSKALLAVVALHDPPPLLALLAAAAPVELEEDVAVEVGEDVVEVDLDLAHAPGRAAPGSARQSGRQSERCRRWSGGASSTTTGLSRSSLASERIRSTSEARASSSISSSIVSSPAKASLQ